MATYTTSKHYFGSGTPYYYGKMTLTTSSTNTKTTVSWKIELIQKYGSYYGVGVKISGSASGTVTGYATSVKSSEYTLISKSGSVSFARGTSAASKTFTITAYGTSVGGYGSAGGSVSKSGSVSIPALASYTVSYNANGGSGAPSSQTKYYGKTLTLSSTKPTRTGHTFQGWATSSTATSASYAAGASYTANSGTILYAVWKANTWTVSYNANGGTGAPGSQTKTYGQALTLSTTKPTLTNYNFIGWGTSSTATSASYQPGGSYTDNAAAILYAVWELAYISPKITDVEILRADGSGNDQEDGIYANISFNWQTDAAHETASVATKTITVDAKAKTDSVFTTIASMTKTGNSGTVELTNLSYGNNTFDQAVSYDIRISVNDTVGSATYTSFLSVAFFTMDFLAGGHGIAFGAPSKQAGFVNAMFPMVFQLPDNVTDNLSIYASRDSGAADATIGAYRTDTDVGVGVGIGTGGVNHGLMSYDATHTGTWILYKDANGEAVSPLKLKAEGLASTRGAYEFDPDKLYAMMLGPTSATAFSTSNVAVPLTATAGTNSWLTNTSGRVYVNGDCYVEVGGYLYYTGTTAGDAIYMTIRRSGSNIFNTYHRASYANDTIVMPPLWLSIDAGQYIDIAVKNSSGARGQVEASSFSRINVKVVGVR